VKAKRNRKVRKNARAGNGGKSTANHTGHENVWDWNTQVGTKDMLGLVKDGTGRPITYFGVGTPKRPPKKTRHPTRMQGEHDEIKKEAVNLIV